MWFFFNETAHMNPTGALLMEKKRKNIEQSDHIIIVNGD